MIKLILSDIDGVLTDGKLWISNNRTYLKSLCFKDIDTRSVMEQKEIKFGLITGENNEFTSIVKDRFKPDFFFTGCKDKANTILEIAKKENISVKDICYIGDGKYDKEAIQIVGIGMCPKDAINEVKDVANYVLETKGGDGCLSELIYILDHKKNNHID